MKYVLDPASCWRTSNSKKYPGFSLIEIVAAVAVFGVTSSILFGIFFSNIRLETELSVSKAAKEVGGDLRSFIEISKYDYVYNLAKNREWLGVTESNSNDVVENKFEVCSIDEIVRKRIKYVCRISIVDDPIDCRRCENGPIDRCYFCVVCDVFHRDDIVRGHLAVHKTDVLPRYSFVAVKNR